MQQRILNIIKGNIIYQSMNQKNYILVLWSVDFDVYTTYFMIRLYLINIEYVELLNKSSANIFHSYVRDNALACTHMEFRFVAVRNVTEALCTGSY